MDIIFILMEMSVDIIQFGYYHFKTHGLIHSFAGKLVCTIHSSRRLVHSIFNHVDENIANCACNAKIILKMC